MSLYTVFTPWFGLMMIWAFGYKLGWFPLGKFLDPRVWTDAAIEANTLFGQMLVAAGLISILAIAALVIARRRQLPHTTLIGVGVLALAAAAALGIFTLAGTAHLALNVVSHMVLPVVTLTLISFAGTMLLTRNQHARDDARGLRPGRARQGPAGIGSARPPPWPATPSCRS